VPDGPLLIRHAPAMAVANNAPSLVPVLLGHAGQDHGDHTQTEQTCLHTSRNTLPPAIEELHMDKPSLGFSLGPMRCAVPGVASDVAMIGAKVPAATPRPGEKQSRPIRAVLDTARRRPAETVSD
jgi:hypothetical protein